MNTATIEPQSLAAIVLVSAFAAPVAAGTFEDAVDAHAGGDYAKALHLIRPLANDGDAGRLQTKATPPPSFYSGTNTQTAKGYRRTLVRR
jgi:hypothetical protein